MLLWLNTWQVWKTYPFHQKGGGQKASPQGAKDWSNGLCLTHSGSEWRSDAAVCSLSQTLESGPIDPRYYLSQRACEGILRRSEKRKKSLPPALYEALMAMTKDVK